MAEIDIYIRIVITILGLAYPILLQVISKLDEKYSSNHIVGLFDNEFTKRCFSYLLIISLIFIIIWSFKLKPIFQLDGWNYFINNSANFLVFFSSTLLIIFFFLFVNKILIYYTPNKFIKYLISKHNKNKSNIIYFNALSDVFLNSIQKQNYTISRTVSRFFYDAFKEKREKFISEPVEYPEEYYSLVNKTIEELAILKNKKNSELEYRTSGGIWLLGELPGFQISETTYLWLWRNIILAIKYDQDDMIIFHWEVACNYFKFQLAQILPLYDGSYSSIKNQKEIELRDGERNRFLEFHYALGGLLLYCKKYSCLKRLFQYTTNQPPKFVLLPENMDEIFKRFIEFNDSLDLNFIFISSKYYFPNQNGINSDDVIKEWILNYLSVLFLRQYTLFSYLSTMKPVDLPKTPLTQSGKREFLDNIGYFKKIISKTLENSELINILHFDFMTKEWLETKNSLRPFDFFIELEKRLKKEYELGAIQQEISDDKVKEFYKATARIIEEKNDEYLLINNENIISQDFNFWSVNGIRSIISKDAFSKTSGIHYMNYDSIFASSVAFNIKDVIESSFLYNKTRSYLLRHDEIFKAIDKLNLNQNYVIINFGLTIAYFIESLNLKGLSVDNYKNIKIISIDFSRVIDPSIFIIRKIDLPFLIFQEIQTNSDPYQKFKLEKISSKINLYASVLDLNHASEELRNNENQKGLLDVDLKKSVLINIFQSFEIRWKKKIELIQIIEYSEYKQMGLPNTIDEIAPLINE